MVTCAVMTSLMGCMVTTYLFFRYTMCMGLGITAKTILFGIFVLMGCIPLLIPYKLENILGAFYPIYRYAMYFIFIACIILFAVTLVSDAFLFLLSYTKIALKSKFFWCFGMNYVNIAVALLCAAYALYEGTKIPDIKEVKIVSAKVSQEQTIALLSDIHLHRAIFPHKIKEIVEKTNSAEPDAVILAGDIIDDDVDKIADMTSLLKGLKAKKGIYFVTGNHEFYTGYHETVKALKNLGFTILENNGETLGGNVYVAGIPDLFSSKGYGTDIDLNQAFSSAPEGSYRLLVSHTPADFGKDNVFDLEVSGHTHGGQIFPFHLLAKLRNKYLAGLYTMDEETNIYVSRGAGQWGPQMRFLAPSEITLIKLKPQQGKKQVKKAQIDTIFNQGEINPYGKFFTGQTYLQRLSAYDDVWHSSVANVTFEPGARTNWHRHSGGQILLVLGGEGRYQERGKEIRILKKGDVVRIPVDVDHWHGAAPNSWFTHISIETNGENNKTDWLEPVTDEEYK